MHKFKISAIVAGSLVSAGILAAMIFNLGGIGNGSLFSNVQASDTEPKNVTFTVVDKTSVTMEWSTDQSVIQTVEYGTENNNFNLFLTSGERTKNHIVHLTLLSPNTTYFVRIRSINDQIFTNNGVPWTFKTSLMNSEENTNVPESSCNYTTCDDIKAHLMDSCGALDLVKNNCKE